MLRRNMLTADCQNSGVKGKRLGLHSTVFSESDDENTRLNNKNQSKKAENVGNCGVEMWRGGLGAACRFPALSAAGASLSGPCSVSTSRSSNRMCGFPASGSRRKGHDVAHASLLVRLVRR